MSLLKWVIYGTVSITIFLSLPTAAFDKNKATATVFDKDKTARLKALMGLEIAELAEIEIKLDDVFDIFDGLVKTHQVSIASGISQDTTIAPAVTTLITQQDIEAIGARTLDEALELVPGLHVGKRGSGYDYIYTLRGIHTNPSPEVLVMINGIPSRKAYDGRTNLNYFPVSMIQRIEVIRGPGSALYGADAFAGVINIITKTATNWQGTEIGGRLGSYSSKNTWIEQSKQYENFNLTAIADWDRTDGHDGWIEEDGQTKFDHIFGTKASLAPGSLNAQRDLLRLYLNAGIGKHWNWHGILSHGNDAGLGLGKAQALDPQGTDNYDTLITDVNYHNADLFSEWKINAQLSYQFTHNTSDYMLYPPGAFGGSFSEGLLWRIAMKSEQTQFESSASFHGWHNHIILMGTGWQQQGLTEVKESRNWDVDLTSGMPYSLGEELNITDNARFLPTKKRRNLYVYLQDSWDINSNWALTTGIRYDDFSDFGNVTNPRVALTWKATPEVTGKLLYGSAFRAPTFIETDLNNPLLGIGNNKLKPETIDTYEVALDWRVNTNMHFTLNLFHYNIKDKIGFPDGQMQYANYGKWQGKGLEAEARWKISPYTALLLNYAYQGNEDEYGNPIADAWRHAIYTRLDWMFLPNWFLDINSRWIADRPRARNDWRPKMDDYFITDLTVRYKEIKGNWNVALGLRNLFDADAREPTTVNIGVTNDLPLPKRNWFIEVRYHF